MFSSKYLSILSLKSFRGVTVWTTPLRILIGIVDNGKTLGIDFKNSRLEKVSKFLGIIGPIITSELVIFSLLDICNILFLEFSVSKTLTLTEIFNFFKSSIANKKPE